MISTLEVCLPTCALVITHSPVPPNQQDPVQPCLPQMAQNAPWEIMQVSLPKNSHLKKGKKQTKKKTPKKKAKKKQKKTLTRRIRSQDERMREIPFS